MPIVLRARNRPGVINPASMRLVPYLALHIHLLTNF